MLSRDPRRKLEVGGVPLGCNETSTQVIAPKPIAQSLPLPPRPPERHIGVILGTAAFVVAYNQLSRNNFLSSLKSAVLSPVPLNALGAVLLSMGESSALTSLYVAAGSLNVLNEGRLSYFGPPESKTSASSRFASVYNWAKSQLLSPGVCAGITSLVYASSAIEFLHSGDITKAIGFGLFALGLRSVKTEVMEKIYDYEAKRFPVPFRLNLPPKAKDLLFNPGTALASGNALLAAQKVFAHGPVFDLANVSSLIGIGIGGFVLVSTLRDYITGKNSMNPSQAIATSGVGDSIMGIGTAMLGNLQSGMAFFIFGIANLWYGQLGVKQAYPEKNLRERLKMLVPHRAQ